MKITIVHVGGARKQVTVEGFVPPFWAQVRYPGGGGVLPVPLRARSHRSEAPREPAVVPARERPRGAREAGARRWPETAQVSWPESPENAPEETGLQANGDGLVSPSFFANECGDVGPHTHAGDADARGEVRR